MNVVCSPNGIVSLSRPAQGCTDIKKADMNHMLLYIPLACQEHELEKINPEQQNQEESSVLFDKMKPMLSFCKSAGLKFPMAYAPFLERDTKRVDLNGLLRKLAEESLSICEKVEAEYLVVRPLFAGIPKELLWNQNRKYYLSLAQTAKEKNIKILLENQCKNVNGHLVRGICADPVEASEWIDKLNEEADWDGFGFCLNVGVANLCGQNMYECMKQLGNRVKAVILSDCDGHRESRRLPFTCADRGGSQTDWLGLIRGLREISFDGELVMDFADTVAAFSPILKPEIVRLAKSVGDYFKWQIELESLLQKYSGVVLFGAGNMCRNYMKCYGEKYPPLFTCDNNKDMWGQEFCGLTVKSPESLKEIPKDCAIFICNIYYREIEQQLRDMGIENPIEFFNDEYMPTFYFDRI